MGRRAAAPLAVDRLLRQPRARRGAHRQPARRAFCPPQYRQYARPRRRQRHERPAVCPPLP